MKPSVPTICAFALAAALAFSSGCSRSGGSNESATAGSEGQGRPGARGAQENRIQAAPAAVPVEVEEARTGPIASFLAYNSTIEVETAVDIFPEVGGLVEKVLVEEGYRVKAGDPLLQLEHDVLRVDLDESAVNLAHLESTFQRTEELFRSGLITQQAYDTQKYELEQARLRAERARLRVEQATVRAPVHGVITERVVSPGARVGTGTKLFSLMSLDDMIAKVHVPGRYLTAVAENQEAYLTSEFLPGRSFSGWVKRISPVVDPASGTFRVTVGVTPAADPPPPGLFVNVRIVTDRRENAVLVPKRAVVYEGGERYVFLVREEKAAKVRLQVGYEEGDVVEALASVREGDSIVVLGQNALKDQAAVRVVNTPAPEPTAAAATASTGTRAADS